MAIGESSGAHEEEVFTDIPVDTEQLVGYAPVSPIVETDPEEDEPMESAEPVVGGFMRSDSQALDTESEDSPARAEDLVSLDDPAWSAESGGVPEEGSPVYQHFQTDLLMEYAGRIEDLEEIVDQREARIAHLEEQNAVHQQMENAYRDEAYQREIEVVNLQARIQQLESTAPVVGSTVQSFMFQISQLRQTVERMDARDMERRVVLQATWAELDRVRADRSRLHEAWSRATMRVGILERETRVGSAKMDALEYTLDTSFDRLRDRVLRYPREAGNSRRWIRRRTVEELAHQAVRRAVRRSRR